MGTRVTGAACPQCGCRDTAPVDGRPSKAAKGSESNPVAAWFGGAAGQLGCNHCGHVFTPSPRVEVKCPACGSLDAKVRSTREDYRYFRCVCGQRFKVAKKE